MVKRSGAACLTFSTALIAPSDRKSTRLNSSHLGNSYAVFCSKKKMVSYQQTQITACLESILEITNLSQQEQLSQIMRQMLTQEQTASEYYINDQSKEVTRKV